MKHFLFFGFAFLCAFQPVRSKAMETGAICYYSIVAAGFGWVKQCAPEKTDELSILGDLLAKARVHVQTNDGWDRTRIRKFEKQMGVEGDPESCEREDIEQFMDAILGDLQLLDEQMSSKMKIGVPSIWGVCL